MHEAFERAAVITQRWCDDKPDSFPPTVINITDGAANYPDLTADAARKVMNLHTTDGSVLIFNIHIANNMYQVIFPHNTDQLVGDGFAEFLFSLSSALPEPLREEAKKQIFHRNQMPVVLRIMQIHLRRSRSCNLDP